MSNSGRRWRATVVRRLPATLVEYPFECLTSFVAALMGTALLSGSLKPGSLFALLPLWIVAVYALAAIVGALTTAVGLRRRNDFVVSLGLRLISMILGVYGVALIGFAGWKEAGFAASFFIAKSITALLRSLYLRASIDVRAALRKEGL